MAIWEAVVGQHQQVRCVFTDERIAMVDWNRTLENNSSDRFLVALAGKYPAVGALACPWIIGEVVGNRVAPDTGEPSKQEGVMEFRHAGIP